jgi:serine/threonine-protein kinase
MEYLVGESLAATLRRERRLPLGRAIALLLQICEGLEVAHRAGIVHRDLKPDNLLITQHKDGTDWVKILDFGIAKLVDPAASGEVTQSGAVLGTPFYMAPEQARGEKSVDFRVDVYALGVLAYELFSGQKPHPGDGYNAILAHILTQPITPLAELCPHLPRELVAVVERALAFEPERRQDSAAQVARELLPFAAREVPMEASHFDLRSPTSTTAGGATRDTDEAPPRAATSTLSSAVGDVSGAAASRPAARRAPWLVLAIAVPAAALVAVKLRHDVHRAVSEPVASAAPTAAAASPRSSALPLPSFAPTTTQPSALPEASTAPPKPRSQPPMSPARRRAASAETTFDEKNPY